MAWQAVTDVNDGQSFGGTAWQTAIDAVAELQTAIGPDVPTTTLAELETQVNPDTLTLNDDQAAFIVLSASGTRFVAAFCGNNSGAGHGLLCARVGSGAYGLEIAGVDPAGGLLVVTSGAGLAGTTGTDGNLTISAHTSLNRLYVENRVGGVRSYGFSFLSMNGGELTNGTWNIV